jgi:hypothetical protein
MSPVIWGISRLVCRSHLPVEAEYKRGYKEATGQTKQMRTIKELWRVDKGKIVTSPLDYMQLKLNIGTYCALLWSLFGKECDYTRSSSRSTGYSTVKNALQSEMPTQKRYVQGLRGQLSTTDNPFLDETQWHRTLPRDIITSFLFPAFNPLLTWYATHYLFSVQPSQSNG